MIALLREKITARPVLMAASLSLCTFFILLCFSNVTLNADDYVYLNREFSTTGLNIHHFDQYITRFPLGVLCQLILSKSYKILSLKALVFAGFFVFVTSLCLILNYLLSEIKNMRSQDFSAEVLSKSPLIFMAATLVMLYPTHYEILYWFSDLPWILGLLFWSISLGQSRYLQIIFIAISLLFTENFFLPMLTFPFLLPTVGYLTSPSSLWKSKLKDHAWKSNLSATLIGILLYFLVRLLLAETLGLKLHPYDLNFSPIHILNGIISALKLMWGMHFYGVNNGLTLIYIFSLLYLLRALLKQSFSQKKGILLLLIIAFANTVIYWPYGHSAPRALFGAQIMHNIVMFILIFLVQDSKKIRIALASILMTFLVMTATIFQIKSQNYEVLQALEKEWVQKMNACTDPCELAVADLAKDLQRDWVLDSYFWANYLEFIKNKNGISKEITYDTGKFYSAPPK